MPAKKTQEQVERELNKKLRPCVSFKHFKYTHNEQIISLNCTTHGESSQRLSVIIRKKANHSSGCTQCSEINRRKTLTKTQEQAELELSEKLRECVTFKPFIYTGKSQPIEFTCTKHGNFTQRIDMAKRKGGCQKCGKEISDTIHNIDFNEFKHRSIEKFCDKFTYHKDKYTDYREETTVTCDIHGDIKWPPYQHLRSLSGCNICGEDVRIASRVSFSEFVARAKAIHQEKYTYHKELFTGLSSPTTITCNTHGEFTMKPGSHLQGYGCSICGYNKVAKINTVSHESFVAKATIKHNDIYDYSNTRYTKAHNKVTISCKTHGKFIQDAYAHLNGHGCPSCAHAISKPELEVLDFLSAHAQTDHQNRSLIAPKEIDIYLPENKVGVEFNGLFWHSDAMHTNAIKTHQEKHVLCKEKGIKLIQIWSDDWQNKRQLVESMLLSAIGISKAIYARKTIVRDVKGSVARTFLNDNHLNGFRPAKIHKGLYYKDELVMVMSLAKPSVFMKNQTTDLEILRMATKQGYRVTGGTSKILATVEFNTLSTFADALWFDGSGYEKVGFEPLGLTAPGYSYIPPGEKSRQHRFNFTKKKIKEKFDNFDNSLSEKQNMINNGYYRLYDAGHYKFIMTRTN